MKNFEKIKGFVKKHEKEIVIGAVAAGIIVGTALATKGKIEAISSIEASKLTDGVPNYYLWTIISDSTMKEEMINELAEVASKYGKIMNIEKI